MVQSDPATLVAFVMISTSHFGVVWLQMPALPPTLAAPPLRSAAMRNKRPAIRFSGQVAVNRDDDPSSVVRSTKRERSASAHSEQSADSVVDIPNSPNSSIIILHGGRYVLALALPCWLNLGFCWKLQFTDTCAERLASHVDHNTVHLLSLLLRALTAKLERIA